MSSPSSAPFIKDIMQGMNKLQSMNLGGLILTASAFCIPLFTPSAAGAWELTPGLAMQTELTFEAETRRNFDLDDTEGDGLTFLEPRINIELEAEPADQIKAVIETEATLHEVVEDKADDDDDEQKLEIKQAYIQFEPDNTNASIIAGRQDISDEMQWLIDEELDGARAVYEGVPFGLDVYAGRKRLFNLATPDEAEERINTYAAFLRYTISQKTYVDSYVFYRDGTDAEEDDLLFFGVQSIGKLSSELHYWFNAAYLTGNNKDEQVDISAFGGDAGATYVFDTRFEPSITLGFAYGSGDSDPSDGDGNFRQTGLHDNDYRLNGVTRFHYLGELLNPEIGNLMIFTAGLGIKPSEKSSLDLVYHYYRQVEPVDEFVDTNLNIDPDGVHKDVGHAVDLVFGYHEITNVSFEAVAGAFFPGAAFPDASGNAFFGNIEVKYLFQ